MDCLKLGHYSSLKVINILKKLSDWRRKVAYEPIHVEDCHGLAQAVLQIQTQSPRSQMSFRIPGCPNLSCGWLVAEWLKHSTANRKVAGSIAIGDFISPRS